jgi:signal transduction histidine kinase
LRNIPRDAVSGVGASLFRVSEWSVRRKVVAVLAIPVILAAVFGGLRVRTELKDASDFSSNQQRATVLGPAIDYLTATERLALPTALANQMGNGSGGPDAAYKTAETNLTRAGASSDLTAEQSGYVDNMLQIGKTLETGSGTGSTADPSTQISDMNRLAAQLVNSTLNSQGTPSAESQALIQALNGRVSLVKQQLLIQSADQQSSLLGSVWLAAEIGVEGTALDNLKSAVGGHRVSVLIADNGTRLGLATSSKVSDLQATPRMFTVYDALGSRLLGNIESQLASGASKSKTRALTDGAIILTALLASLILALFVARALIVPLRKVRAGALEVANQRLPETVARIRAGQEPDEFTPIPVHSREELGQLARAVDDMHRQAVNLATGEAQLRAQVGAMFVTLSRRNTTLVNQQLALIESLEQDEEDPQRLEQLFSLDHLATRMRRTAESLVILGGTEGRTASFEELSVSDIIHAAVSEVQDYQRVRIEGVPERMVSGRAASDIVHLMAELIDNALSYSPPGSPVSIQASDDDGKVAIEIVDNGLGMAGDALAQANDSLKRGGEVTVDTARRMGLFVVSRLAEDHGLTVKLRRNSNGGGIIASITLPTAALVSTGPVEYVSVLDASEQEDDESVAPVVVENEPEEEYDPYLERIEEAIAAVTGLPRRRPGVAKTPVEEVAPVPAVGMFEATPNPELPAAFEPTELPSRQEGEVPDLEPLVAATQQADTTYDPLAGHDGLSHNAEALDAPWHEDDSELAEVVSPDFGAERPEPITAEAEPTYDLVDEPVEDPLTAPIADSVDEPVTEPVAEPIAEPIAEPVAEADRWTPAGPVEHSWAATEPTEPTELSEPTGPLESVEPAEPDVAEVAEQPAAETTPFVAPAVEPAAAVDVPPVEAPAAEAQVRLQIRRPLSAAASASVLEGDFVAEKAPSEDSPIFGQLRSNWLSDDEEQGERWNAGEVDRAWDAAERVEDTDADAEGTTRTGLPVRRPGGRLLPGGVSQEPAKVVRDPEAIRNRLAAHAAGVSRGRAAAAAEPFTDDYAHEETGPA